MSLRDLRSFVVGALLVGCGRRAPRYTVAQTAGYAQVTADSAILVFPPSLHAGWALNIDESSTSINDYYWIVVIPHAPRYQLIWFMVDETPSGHRTKVTVDQFLARARLGAGLALGGGPYVQQLDSIRLAAIAINGRPSLVVRGRTSIERLFDQRPPFVEFVRHTRGEQSVFDTVAVTYR